MKLTIACAVLAACTHARMPPDGPRPLAIVGATVVFPERDTGTTLGDATVVIAGDRITAVGPRASTPVPDGAAVLDGKGRWLIPGMVDSHVHFFQSGNLYTRPDAADFTALVPYAQEVARNKARLPATFAVWLASGVTSVIDVGGPFWNFAARDAAMASESAPRVETTGPLISMVARPQLELDDPPIIKVESAEAARALVARELPRHPDFIKVWFIHREGEDLAAQEAIVAATAAAAHAAHLRLAVHATELDTAKAAVRAGADYLVHSVFREPIDDELVQMILAHHVLVCPTLFVTTGYPLALSNQWQATPDEQRLADPQVLATRRRRRRSIPPTRRFRSVSDWIGRTSRMTLRHSYLKRLGGARVPRNHLAGMRARIVRLIVHRGQDVGLKGVAAGRDGCLVFLRSRVEATAVEHRIGRARGVAAGGRYGAAAARGGGARGSR